MDGEMGPDFLTSSSGSGGAGLDSAGLALDEDVEAAAGLAVDADLDGADFEGAALAGGAS